MRDFWRIAPKNRNWKCGKHWHLLCLSWSWNMRNNDLPSIGLVISHYGADVYRTSGQGPIKCPFHDDKHASAGIDFSNNLFNCFTCGVKGNSLQIIAQREGVNIGKAALIAEGITGESHVKLRGEY